MRQIDSTAQSIDALIQTAALDAARDLLRAELGPLSAHVGAERVDAWCAVLGLPQLLELPKAIAAAHVVREKRGTAAIAEFLAIAQTARARGDDNAEYRALAGLYCTGLQVWSGFGAMQRAASRINELHGALGHLLAKDVAIECLSGLMAARMLFTTETSDAAPIGEALVRLTLDDSLDPAKRLCAAMVLAPWFEQKRDGDRMHRIAHELRPLMADETISLAMRLNHRTSIALTDANLSAGQGTSAPEPAFMDQLMAEATELDTQKVVPQWLSFYVHRVALQVAVISNDPVRSTLILAKLEAMADPSEASQLLRLHYIRAHRALRLHEYSLAFSESQRCVELARALEMPKQIALVYESGEASALLGLRRLGEARAIFLTIIESSIPGHRAQYQRHCALINATLALDVYEAHAQGNAEAAPRTETARHSLAILRAKLSDYLRECGGRLPPPHAKVFPHITAPIVAVIFAHGLGTESLAQDVQTYGLSPPESRRVSWPWLLKIRLFDGFSIEGIAAGANDSGKKGESISMQILQFVAAHAPVAIGTQRLADALWPEADGDKAMRSLDVSLNRLRQVLPDAGLLFRRDGKVGLDMDRVWCDTYAVLGLVERLRSYVNANGGEHPVNDERLQEAYDAQTALEVLDLYRGPLLPDSREGFVQDRATFFRSKVAGAAQMGLRAPIHLPDQMLAEEIVRKSVGSRLPPEVVSSVVADLQARGADASRRAAQLSDIFKLART